VLYRQARRSDIPMMAEIRAADWGSEQYWRERMLQYLMHQLHPRDALRPRVSLVCVEHQRVVGSIAGHLARRFGVRSNGRRQRHLIKSHVGTPRRSPSPTAPLQSACDQECARRCL
jgi:hypothetical protein